MLRQIKNTTLILIALSFIITALTLIATLKPGGIILGMFFLGLCVLMYFLWMMTRALLQIRELLMLSITQVPKVNENNKPANGSSLCTKLHADS